MQRGRFWVYVVCMATAMAILITAYLGGRPRVADAQYTSIHSMATIAPLTGFASDALVNTGNLNDLDALPGVGPVIAQRIIDVREMIGGYRLPEDLTLVKGIGEKTLADILAALTDAMEILPEIQE